MCKWPAINGVVIHAIKSGKYADDEIRSALLRMADSGQTVTVESLRLEIEGFTPRPGASQHRQSTGDRAVAEGEALKAQLRNQRELA